MTVPWALRGLRRGVVTTPWPRRRDPYFDDFPAAVGLRPEPGGAENASPADLCPTGAISAGDLAVDQGRCILCGSCVRSAPGLFAWERGSGVARLTRDGLVARSGGGTDDELAEVRRELARRVARLRRSIHVRHVDCGSDGSDEWEVQALLNPVYDVHRLGIFFTASPRHADILLVTGIGTAGMVAPLRRTREAMPDPVVVIATGVDAVSGGLFKAGYTGGVGVSGQVDVDVWVAGSPATPFGILHGILLGIGLIDEKSGTAS